VEQEEYKTLVRATVKETLFEIGILVDDNSDIAEVRKDMEHLRKWRVAVQQVETKGILTAVGIVVTGFLAAAWVGFQMLFGHH
jgi:hypothetical protein